MKMHGWPVSRILSRRLPALDDHSSAPALTDGIQLPTRASRAEASLRRYPVGPVPREAPIRHCSGRGLPCHSCCQDRGGLLPHRFTITLTGSGAMPGSGLSLLCCAFPRVTPAGGYPAPLLHGVRTFLGTRLRAPAVIRPSVRSGAYVPGKAGSTANRVSAPASCRSAADSGPCPQGRKRSRKARSSSSSEAAGS